MSLESCFQGKSAIVTGAGRGIGRAITKRLDSLGCLVYAVSRNPDNLASLKSECSQVEVISVDLSNWPATRAAIDKIGPVDFLVNNAATVLHGQFLSITSDDLDSMFNVNLKAVVNVSQVVAGKMVQAKKGGSIVNISSVAGLKSITYVAAYGTLKAALDHLTKVMAVELGQHGIRVNSVNPGGVNTERAESEVKAFLEKVKVEKIQEESLSRIPMKRPFVEMDEVVNGVIFCLSDLVPNVTGIIMPIDGGFSAN